MERITTDKHTITAVQKLPKNSSEVIQYVSRRLRVWVQDDQHKTIRPYYHFAVRLYPDGRVIGYELCKVPNNEPNANQVFDFLCRMILDPPTGEEAHRPGIISFSDQELERQLAQKLSSIGIQVQILQPAEGLEVVKAVSESLIKRELATRTDANERPGMLSKQGVELSLVQTFFSIAYRLRQKGPWSEFSENEVYGIRLLDRFRFVVILGSSKNVFGIAISSSLSHFRKKYCQAMGMSGLGSSSSEVFCTFCGAQQLLYTYRCSQCKFAHYCNEKCQKKDWPIHKRECHNSTIRKREDDTSRPYLKRKEMTLLYCTETAIPFDDLDLQYQYCFPLYPTEDNFPVAFVMIDNVDNVLDRPTKEELQWLVRLCEVLVDSSGKPILSLSEDALVQDEKWIYIETLGSHSFRTATQMKGPKEMEAKD
ncbi:hypothetical protein GpartN1_g1909.t1 [Galdieria partita]|uniref:MYND-type domain-containing protein n=1 Tax=Galdieria partita TaxID=83374 RepID=A0A9C7UNR8_9RHOD|nr:hypothetical protein GpartN1_g1909.t1 [Galdieria partita]